MFESGELLLTVRQTTAADGLPVGLTLAVAGPAILGRSPEAASPTEPHPTADPRPARPAATPIRLSDRTISRRHARVWPAADGWWIEHLAGNNGCFLNGRPLVLGDAARLSEGASLQLGGVVFAVQVVLGTLPFNTPITPPPPGAAPERAEAEPTPSEAPPGVVAGASPLLVVRRDGDGCTVHCGDRLLPLAPTAALVLAALARRPGAVVHLWDIHDDVGYACNLPQAVSAIRRALRALIDEGSLATATLAKAVAAVYAEAFDPTDPAVLLRVVLLARRGHGYGLMLPAAAVQVEEEG